MTDTADSFDPAVSFNSVGMQLVYDSILVKDPFTGEITSDIAESWDYTDDCTLVIQFRDDVYFSNGEKMTAEDASVLPQPHDYREFPLVHFCGCL